MKEDLLKIKKTVECNKRRNGCEEFLQSVFGNYGRREVGHDGVAKEGYVNPIQCRYIIRICDIKRIKNTLPLGFCHFFSIIPPNSMWAVKIDCPIRRKEDIPKETVFIIFDTHIYDYIEVYD